MPVFFHNQNTSFSLSNKDRVSSWIKAVYRSESEKQLSLNFIFCDDKYLLEINQKYLLHDELTDVITFPLEETERYLEAEVYISIDRIRENALKYDVSPEQELLRVMVHGVLHLLGYDDKDSELKEEMTAMEEEWLSEWTKRTS